MDLQSAGARISEAARGFHQRGWVLGTSGNFSCLLSDDPLRVCITSSGKDKGKLKPDDFLVVNGRAEVESGQGKPSAETLLHLAVYREVPGAGAVFHTHSVWGTLLGEKGDISLSGYEMLKGLSGVSSHEHTESVPVIENSQDYDELSGTVKDLLRERNGIHGIYLRRHGLYTWGADIDEAARHIEIFEFLFEAEGRRTSFIDQ